MCLHLSLSDEMAEEYCRSSLQDWTCLRLQIFVKIKFHVVIEAGRARSEAVGFPCMVAGSWELGDGRW